MENFIDEFPQGLSKYIYEEIILLYELKVKLNPDLLKQNKSAPKLINYSKVDEIKEINYIEDNKVYFKNDKKNYYTSILSHFRNCFAHGNFKIIREKKILFEMRDKNKYGNLTMKCKLEKKVLENFIKEVKALNNK